MIALREFPKSASDRHNRQKPRQKQRNLKRCLVSASNTDRSNACDAPVYNRDLDALLFFLGKKKNTEAAWHKDKRPLTHLQSTFSCSGLCLQTNRGEFSCLQLLVPVALNRGDSKAGYIAVDYFPLDIFSSLRTSHDPIL